LRDVRERAAPATVLARVQAVWPEVAGPAIAAAATPVRERDGVVHVGCRAAVWAQELELMAPQLLKRLNERVGGGVAGLRFAADGDRYE
jgi:predicted nucleic acid-binding Zn ribbon protein